VAQFFRRGTFPDQLSEARTISSINRAARKISTVQNWDVSVKAVAHYPTVLDMMVNKRNWTTSVGQAYVEEPDHVMGSVQRLRVRANHLGPSEIE